MKKEKVGTKLLNFYDDRIELHFSNSILGTSFLPRIGKLTALRTLIIFLVYNWTLLKKHRVYFNTLHITLKISLSLFLYAPYVNRANSDTITIFA